MQVFRVRQVYQFEGVAVAIDDTEVSRLFKALPRETFVGMRDYVGQIAGSFRRTWLEYALGALKGPRKEGLLRTVKYRITPPQGEVPEPINLSAITASFETKSAILLGLEKGGTYGPKNGSRYLAIPVPGGPAVDKNGIKKPAYASPKFARMWGGVKNTDWGIAGKENSSAKAATFFVFISKKTGKKFLSQLFSKGASSKKKYWFALAWRLETQVTVKPVLRFLATWQEMASDRAVRLERTKLAIVEKVKRDVRR